jgi:SWI/SNF-related matrix-associated actin-dependent regulator of chromatin subfamily A member 5
MHGQHCLSTGSDARPARLLLAPQGLGKTLQTISFLAYMQSERGVAGPSLVVVPLSVISSWLAEFRRWAPHLRVVRVHGSDIAEKLRVRNEARPRRNSLINP